MGTVASGVSAISQMLVDPQGNIYTAWSGSAAVRKITTDSVETVFQGPGDTVDYHDLEGVSGLALLPSGDILA